MSAFETPPRERSSLPTSTRPGVVTSKGILYSDEKQIHPFSEDELNELLKKNSVVIVTEVHGDHTKVEEAKTVPKGLTLHLLQESTTGHCSWTVGGTYSFLKDVYAESYGKEPIDRIRSLQDAMLRQKASNIVIFSDKVDMTPTYLNNYGCRFLGDVNTYPECLLQSEGNLTNIMVIGASDEYSTSAKNPLKIDQNIFGLIAKRPGEMYINMSDLVDYLPTREVTSALIICLHCTSTPGDTREEIVASSTIIESQYKYGITFSPMLSSKLDFLDTISPAIKRLESAKEELEAAEKELEQLEAAEKELEQLKIQSKGITREEEIEVTRRIREKVSERKQRLAEEVDAAQAELDSVSRSSSPLASAPASVPGGSRRKRYTKNSKRHAKKYTRHRKKVSRKRYSKR
jgi:hypothetical protein